MVIFLFKLVVTEWRKIEAPLVSLYPALLFGLPALRNTAPSSPPIGCLLDTSSFYWSMLFVIAGVVTVPIKYLIQAPRPPPQKMNDPINL